MKRNAKALVIFRRLSQSFFMALFIYILWSTTYPLKGFLPAGTFFAADPLVMFLTSLSERIILPGVYISGVLVILTLIFGRFFCGWICPLGAFIDLTGHFGRRNNAIGERASGIARKPKFFILGAAFLAALFGVQVAWVLDPIVIAARFVSLNLIPTATLLIEKIFIFLIRDLKFGEPLYPLYQSLKMSLLGVKVAYFDSSLIIFAFFAVICLISLILSRAWCRCLCPLGALYAASAGHAVLSRKVKDCVRCMKCKSRCRMGAIRDDLSYAKGECILCMDCVYDCPGGRTSFSFGRTDPAGNTLPRTPASPGGISRGQFLFVVVSSIFALAFRWRGGSLKAGDGKSVIRPPAALNEKDFLDRCIRCGNCMKVCPTNGLQPVLLESGMEGIWTPRLVPEIGYCEYNCTLCSEVCPTKAISRVTLLEKHAVKLGTAEVDRSICLPWKENKECIVCMEHCPVPDKAIKADRSGGLSSLIKPVVDKTLCVGCGICQTKCPLRPVRAIRVSPEGAYRP